MKNLRPAWIQIITVPGMVALSTVPGYAVTYLSTEAAQKLCFADATEFIPSDVTLTRDQMRAIGKDSRVNVRLAGQKVWRAKSGDKSLGWFIQDEVVGKHEFINWVLALNEDGSVKQIEILDYRETYGYQVRDAEWRQQFVGKKHGAPLKLDEDIKNISGATLSSKHITDGVKRLLSFYDLVLKT